MESNIDNNASLYTDKDSNFELAYELSERNFSHSELLKLLKNGNIVEKQIAALKFDLVENFDDAKALLDNLTGCDGKIRETISMKINNILQNNESARKIFAEIAADKFADATIDINANICRLIVDSANFLINYKVFSNIYTSKILLFANEALNELDKFIFRDKKYVINKQIFKLYWCLEALSTFYIYINEDILDKILTKCAMQSEYTIREKVAKIIVNSSKFDTIKEQLLNDENYYVKEILHH